MNRIGVCRCAGLLAAAATIILCASVAFGQSTNFDLLLGIGSFKRSTFSSGPADWYGIVPTANMQVADGWHAGCPNDSSYFYRIVNSFSFTDDGSAYMDTGCSYQYMGINNKSGKSANAQLFCYVLSIPDHLDETFRPDDTIVFHIDKMISSGFVSGHQSVQVGIFYTLVGDATEHHVLQNVDLSAGFANNITYTLSVPNLQQVRPIVQLYLGNNTTTAIPTGILLTGAHLWVMNKGATQFKTETIPYSRNRNILTQKDGYSSNALPLRYLAKNYDALVVAAWNYVDFAALRALNPSIKIYLYQTSCAIESSELIQWCLSPLKVDDVAKSNPGWLYPQTVPPLKNDPDSNPALPNSPYVGKYLNINGIPDKYIMDISNKQFEDQWVSGVIQKAKTIGADGVWIDESGGLVLAHDGAQRDTRQCQQFIHEVVPQLRAAGLATVSGDSIANLDGSTSYCGDDTEVLFNPSWTPTSSFPDSAGYTANTPDNTPDVFFREFSFMHSEYRYDPVYWLKCINDAKIIASWNAKLSAQQQKKIHYDTQEADTADHPALNVNGKAGWATFIFASFLLCSNDFIYYGSGYGEVATHPYGDPNIDYSITQKLGVPDGDDTAINNDQYFRMRKYKASGDGFVGGIVVVNAETSTSNSFTLPFDAVDENGTFYASGSAVSFLPNMGRIFTSAAGLINIQVNVPTSSVSPGQMVTVIVKYTNSGTVDVKNVQVHATVPSGLQYVPGSAEASGGVFSSPTNTVGWTISTVAAGQTGTETFKALVK